MIVVILVVAAFVRRAKELDLSPVAWGAAGLASYYVPQLLLGFLLGAYMISQGGYIDESSELGLNLLGIIPGALVAYFVYKKMPVWGATKQRAQNEDILDEDILKDDIRDDIFDGNDFLGRT